MKRCLSRVNVSFRFSLFLRAAAAACLCAAFLTAQSGGVETKDQMAKEAMDAALKALGGADKIGGIKSLIVKAKATTWGFMSSKGGPWTKTNSTTYDIEIRILLPDNFIRINRFPDRTGYGGISQGKSLSTQPATVTFSSSDGQARTVTQVPDAAAKAKVAASNTQIDEWSSFLIGTLAKAGPVPLTLSSGSTSGVFALTKADGDVGEVEFDSKTGYPSVIRTGGFSGNTPDNIINTSGKVSLSIGSGGSGTALETRFSDRFSVNGIMFPRIITTTGTRTDIELRIEDVQINPNLSLKDFEVPKQ